MDYKYAGTYSDISRIDKLNNLTNPYTFWAEVAAFTKNLVSSSAINSWKQLAEIRYNELIQYNGLTESESVCKTTTEKSKEELTLADIENLIKKARTEQKILNNIMAQLHQKLDELSIDLEAPSKAENADCLGDAINCYIHYGEFSLKGLVDEIKEQYNES